MINTDSTPNSSVNSAKTTAKAFTLITVFLLTSCATIHFDNGQVIEDPEPYWFEFWAEDKEYTKADGIIYSQWYHHSMYTIAELSNPIKTEEVCQGLEWNRVTSEFTLFDLIIGLADNALLLPASGAGIDFWSPWSIEYSCRTPQ